MQPHLPIGSKIAPKESEISKIQQTSLLSYAYRTVQPGTISIDQ